MDIIEIIKKKRRGQSLLREEILFFIEGVTSGNIPDYQSAALLMAICINGMNEEETYYLTESMTNSGEKLSRGNIEGICADKHSTGGVSDTTTLIVVPVVAELGIKMAKLSGRGLGHTGGTLDKLECFSGLRVNLSNEEFERTVERVGAAIAGQTAETVPADKKLYELRDVTGTIDSVPLIASSVMSKKLASFADILVLDVKYGSGAFMKDVCAAENLAKVMVELGKRGGRKTGALITSMQQPLGSFVGCNLEVMSAVDVLKGKRGDLYEVSREISAKILTLSGKYGSDEAYLKVDEVLSGGRALSRLEKIIKAQGGSGAELYDYSLFSKPKYEFSLLSDRSGYIVKTDAEKIGHANLLLGGGRLKKEDRIDHAAGIVIKVRIGDFIHGGEELARLYCNDASGIEEAKRSIIESFEIGEEYLSPPPLIYKYLQ